MAKGPLLIDLDTEADAPRVEDAQPVPDVTLPPVEGRAMQAVARLAAKRPSRLAQLFWAVATGLLMAVLSTAAWNWATAWIATQPLVGWIVAGLLCAFVVLLLGLAVRELAALSRLKRIDHLRHAANVARETQDLKAARQLMTRVLGLYSAREDMAWAKDRFKSLAQDQLDAEGLLSLAEREFMSPLDKAAAHEVEAAARQVATVTALVPLALADVAAALTANLRMIRRVSEIYGGRSGTLGGWRLTRAVLGHLVATGAVAVGDDMLEPILGGSLLGKLSRRFGEGVVNGALTARVGAAAIEVCRPLPFHATQRPKARDLVKGALGGLFTSGEKAP